MPAQYIFVAISIAAVVCWGISDFVGGYASKKNDAFLVTLLAHLAGFTLMLSLTVANHAPIPDRTSELWAMAAGALGGFGLALFYGALASGKMGLTAPLAAILGGAIPVAFGIALQGYPGPYPIVGFALAAVGIWLICRPDQSAGSEGLMMAVFSGLGFAGFFICISRTGSASAFWSASYSRFGSLFVVGVAMLIRRRTFKLNWKTVGMGLCAGALDSTGTLLFIRANQSGRLDKAVMLTSLYPVVTVLLARFVLKEHFSRWKVAGILAALAAVPLIAMQ
jgi:drug/metabolite transporter (DMT)-like permease